LPQLRQAAILLHASGRERGETDEHTEKKVQPESVVAKPYRKEITERKNFFEIFHNLNKFCITFATK